MLIKLTSTHFHIDFTKLTHLLRASKRKLTPNPLPVNGEGATINHKDSQKLKIDAINYFCSKFLILASETTMPQKMSQL
jgi:hypothetical protein